MANQSGAAGTVPLSTNNEGMHIGLLFLSLCPSTLNNVDGKLILHGKDVLKWSKFWTIVAVTVESCKCVQNNVQVSLTLAHFCCLSFNIFYLKVISGKFQLHKWPWTGELHHIQIHFKCNFIAVQNVSSLFLVLFISLMPIEKPCV